MIKNQIVRARCTDRERGALLALAQNERVKPSVVLRRLILDAARKRGLVPLETEGTNGKSRS